MVKLNASDTVSYRGHIQELSPNNGPCVVFVEDIGEKCVIPLKNLQSSTIAVRQPSWTPHQYCQKRINGHYEANGFRSDNKFTTKRDTKNNSATNSEKCSKSANGAEVSKCVAPNSFANTVDFEQYTSLSNFQQPYPQEIVAMPLVTRADRSTMANKGQQQQQLGGQSRNNGGGATNQQPSAERSVGQTPQPEENNEFVGGMEMQPQPPMPPPSAMGEIAAAPMPYVAANGNNGLVQYYYSPAAGYSDPNTMYTATPGTEMMPPPGMYPVAAGVPYGSAIPMSAPNTPIYSYGVVAPYMNSSGNIVHSVSF